MKIESTLKIYLCALFSFFAWSCKKTISPPIGNLASLTIVNAIPASYPLIPVFGTTGPPYTDNVGSQPQLGYYQSYSYISAIGYGSFLEYPLPSGSDTAYLVQSNSDTILNSKGLASSFMFNQVLSLKKGGSYSLYLTGTDTSATDYLLTLDTLPYHPVSDSSIGINFVNLSTGSGPVSINQEGNPNGSEVGILPYKSVSRFKNYTSNTSTNSYFFVIRDAATGDSLTQINLGGSTYGATDPNSGQYLTFNNITIIIYGSKTNINYPISAAVVDHYLY